MIGLCSHPMYMQHFQIFKIILLKINNLFNAIDALSKDLKLLLRGNYFDANIFEC